MYFTRNNLHIVLCMSPVGNAFRSRCRMFPSLVNCCSIDWFVEWPREALLSVSQSAFESVDLGSDELKVGQISDKMIKIVMVSVSHSSIEHWNYFQTSKGHMIWVI